MAASTASKGVHVVTLVGDSTLDNVVWVEGGNPVPAHLACVLASLGDEVEYKVMNLAADGFTSEDVLHGGKAVISFAARAAAGDPFPGEDPKTKFEPLSHVAAAASAPDTAALSVVLSCGGNDVRHILGQIHALPTVIPRFMANYAAILEKLAALTPRIVLVMQYPPALDEDGMYGVYTAMSSLPGPGDGLAKLFRLFETVYGPVIEHARRLRLPLIDLPRSFDPRHGHLFKCQIEPSDDGGALIARLVAHALQNHDFKASAFYYLSPDGEDIVVQQNDGSAEWKPGRPACTEPCE